ncbi:insulinase family protein, partial [bacterium]|nr:insulinase family protein [bacterium]
MINHVLSNGLRIIILPNEKAPLVNVTLGYKVGSKDDSFSHKGFAHFFEHLMFDGSKHVKRGEFDALCSKAGGTFNAYTSYDQTMYHTTVPSHQLDLVLWLESDRMLQFGVEQIGLETQQKVVSEEIKQSVENQPYGTWRVEQGRLAFTDDCSYQWEVLGNRSHIESATLDEVASFFDAYYRPDNACLVISGHVDVSTVLKSVERYFGIIPSKKQTIKRNQFVNHMKRTGQIVVQDAVPLPAVFVSYHLDGFMSDSSVQADILASAFGDGKSSRLYSHLVRDQHIASSVFCYADQREHASLLTCSATAAHPGISHQQLLDALDKEIQGLLAEPFSDTELEKAINAAGTGYAYHMQTNAGIADMV